MKKQPRYYQSEAYKALIDAVKDGHRPYANITTGGGKSLIFAMLINQALKQNARVLQLTPSKELCEQNYREAVQYVDSPHKIGVCCAKLHRFEIGKPAVIATYTSFLRRAATSGVFNLLLIDECHLCSPDPETSYQKIIRDLLRLNPNMKIMGATATPYRMDQGMIHEPCTKGEPIFTIEAYKTDIPRMIQEGYLSHVESISGDVEIDLSGVQMSGSDYNTDQVGVKFDAICQDAVADMRVKFEAYGIQTALIFTSTLANARHIMNEWIGSDMRMVYGDMPNHERAGIIDWIRHGTGRRIIVNVGVLTTGFDFQALDCVVLMRATKSLGLYVQMTGRVIRSHDEKKLGYVIDYGTNIERHGPIDATIPPKNKKRIGEAPKKFCLVPECGEVNLLSAKKCCKCGAEFITDSKTGNYSMRTKADILREKMIVIENPSIYYELAFSRNNGLPMVKMKFHDRYRHIHDHYICIEHPGSAGSAAVGFLMNHLKDPDDFLELSKENALNAENLVYLMSNRPEYFKPVKSVSILPVPGSRFKEIKEIEYEHN